MKQFFSFLIREKDFLIFILKRLKGLNNSKSFLICCKLGFGSKTKVGLLGIQDINKLYRVIEKFEVVGSSYDIFFKQRVSSLINVRNYRGVRHLRKLPVRGQRTRSNARTSKRLVFFQN
nr:ribosomal protein S30 [Cyanidiaceae sp.]